MARRFTILSLTLLCALCVSAQSGRVKPAETPTPEPKTPRFVYLPTQDKTGLPAPQPTPTPAADRETEVIRIDSALVPIPVSVIGANGQAITNLKLEDFQLSVDGKSAEISDVFRSEAPVRLALLFDNSSSVTSAREFEKKAAVKFFRRVLRPEKDLAALYSVQSVTKLEQPLTKNVAQLIGAIETFTVPTGATALLDAMITASEYLKNADGRRVIVVVSDGEDTISDSTFEDAVRAVQANNCQVYVVKTTDFENFKRTGQRTGSANLRSLTAERRMQDIAAQTGGAVYSPIDERELDRAFNQISAELSEQYILSYYPEDERRSRGEFRTISLTVKNAGSLIIRARKGYYVPKGN